MQRSACLLPFIPVLCLVQSVFLTASALMLAGGGLDLLVSLPAIATGAGEHQQKCLLRLAGPAREPLGVTSWSSGGWWAEGQGGQPVRFLCYTPRLASRLPGHGATELLEAG